MDNGQTYAGTAARATRSPRRRALYHRSTAWLDTAFSRRILPCTGRLHHLTADTLFILLVVKDGHRGCHPLGVHRGVPRGVACLVSLSLHISWWRLVAPPSFPNYRARNRGWQTRPAKAL